MNQRQRNTLKTKLTASNLSITANFTTLFAEEIDHKINKSYQKQQNQELWGHSEGIVSRKLNSNTF